MKYTVGFIFLDDSLSLHRLVRIVPTAEGAESAKSWRRGGEGGWGAGDNKIIQYELFKFH